MSELKAKIKASTLLRVVIWAVVILIPLMYSFFYLKAFWDPYGNLQDVKVGIVNLDEGANDKNRGEDLSDKLLEKDTLKFEKVDADIANTSLANQEYYALITIPKDFTKNLENADNVDRQITTITYSPNKKSNYLASQIINSAIKTIEKELRAEISQAVVGSLKDKLNEVPDSLEEISNGVGQVQEGTQKLSSSYNEFDEGIDSAYEGSKTLEQGINQIYAGTQSLEDGTKNINTLISSVNTLANSYEQVNAGLKDYVAGVNATTDNVTELLNYLNEYAESGYTDTTALQNAMHKAQSIGTIAQTSAAAGKDAKTVGTKLIAYSTQVNAGIKTLNSKVEDLNKLSEGAKQLNSGVAQLKTGSNSLTSGLEILSTSSKQVKEGINSLDNGVDTLKSSIDEGITNTKQELTKLEGLDEYTSNPVKFEEKSYGEINAYGVGFAPYFISLSLWVGALMAFVVLYYDQENRFKLFGKYAKNKILRTAMYGGLAVVQGLSLGFLLKLGLGYDVTNIWLYYGSCILIAILFLNIIEFLIVTFGDVGKLGALIILVLQLAATGGTFPIETIPSGFQKLSPFLPMTYTIKLMKESLVSIDGNLLQKNSLILIVMTVVFIGINAFNDIIRKKRNITDK